MIKRIDIKNFGSFSEFEWNTSLINNNNVSEFKKLNIIYGRNYSGKTTLSRIFSSYEVRKFPENYPNPQFVYIQMKLPTYSDRCYPPGSIYRGVDFLVFVSR